MNKINLFLNIRYFNLYFIPVFAIDVDTGPAGELTFSIDNPNFIAVSTGTQSAIIRLAGT